MGYVTYSEEINTYKTYIGKQLSKAGVFVWVILK